MLRFLLLLLFAGLEELLDEVGLVGARCIDGRSGGGGLAATTQAHVGTAKQGTENAHGQVVGANFGAGDVVVLDHFEGVEEVGGAG